MKANNFGIYSWELVRDGQVIASGTEANTVTVEGRNHMLNVEFRAITQAASWFFGLVDDDAFADNPDTDTMISHPGWNEFTGYTEATRPQWSPAAPSGGSLSNTTTAVFTINATGTLHGFFIASNSTKGGTAGVLWSSVPFSTGSLPVETGDEIRTTYTYGVTAG